MSDQYLGNVVWYGAWNINFTYNYIPNSLTSWVSYNDHTYLTVNIPEQGLLPDLDPAWVKVSVINGGGGGIDTIRSGTCIAIDNTDPVNPIINIASSGILPALDGNQLINLNKAQVNLSNVQNLDQTNASNLSSGTVGISLLPKATPTALGVSSYPTSGALAVTNGAVNVNVDNSTIQIVNNQLVATATTGGVESIYEGAGIQVDSTDPTHPIVGIQSDYLGTMAFQNASGVNISGGNIDGLSSLRVINTGQVNQLIGNAIFMDNIQGSDTFTSQLINQADRAYLLLGYSTTNTSNPWKTLNISLNMASGFKFQYTDKNNAVTEYVLKKMAFQDPTGVNITGGTITGLALLTVTGTGQNNDLTSDGVITTYTYGTTAYTGKLINRANLGNLLLEYSTASRITNWSKLNITLDMTNGFQFQYTDKNGAANQYTLNNMAFQNSNSVSIAGGTAVLSNLGLTTGTISNSPINGTDLVNKAYVDSKIPVGPTLNSVTIPVLNLGGINGTQSAINYNTRIGLVDSANLGPIPGVNVPTNGVGGQVLGIFGIFSNATTITRNYKVQVQLNCICTSSTGSGDTTSITIGKQSIVSSFKIWRLSLSNNDFTQTETPVGTPTVITVNNKGVSTITITFDSPQVNIYAQSSAYVGVEMRNWFPANVSNTYSLINNVVLTLIDQSPKGGLDPTYLDSDYTVGLDDFNSSQYFIVTSPNVNITLPLLVSVVSGQKIYVKNNSGVFNTTIITSSSTDLIDNNTSYQLNNPLQAIEIWQAVETYCVF